MDYSQEIAANNARINELKMELARLKGQPVLGTNEMDYQLAAQRARNGDMATAQYHLNKPEERDRLTKMMSMGGSSLSNDLEYQYSTWQDKLSEAQDELAWTPAENTAAVKNAERKVKEARIRLKMFERKYPNLVKMHWNWKQSAEKELAAEDAKGNNAQGRSTNTVQGFRALIDQNSYTDPGSGKVFWKDDADPFEIYNYGTGITNAMESAEVRDLLNTVKSRRNMQQSVEDPTMSNLRVFMKDPAHTTKNGTLKKASDREQARKMWDDLSGAERRSEEGQALKRAIDGKTQEEIDAYLLSMRKEGETLLGRVGGDLRDLIASGKKDSFIDEWNRVWKRDARGNWSTPGWKRKLSR